MILTTSSLNVTFRFLAVVSFDCIGEASLFGEISFFVLLVALLGGDLTGLGSSAAVCLDFLAGESVLFDDGESPRLVDFVLGGLTDLTGALPPRRVALLGGEGLITGEAFATTFLDVVLLDFISGEGSVTVSSLLREDTFAESSEGALELFLGEGDGAADAAGFFVALLGLLLASSSTGDFTAGTTWAAFLVLLFGGDIMVGDLLGVGLTDITSSADLPFLVCPLPLGRTFGDSGCGDGLVGVFI